MRGPFAHQPGNDVPADAVPAVLVGRVLHQRLHQRAGGEHVDAHRRQRLVRVARAARRIGGLLPEGLDAVAAGSGLHHAKGGRLAPGHRECHHRDPRAPAGVLADHLGWVHPVHMIGRGDHHQVRLVAIDQVQRLVDRIRRAGLPVRAPPLLRRHRHHVVIQQAAQPPGSGQMPVQAEALVLGQHADPAETRIDQVGQREIHQPVHPAERNGRLGPVRGQRRQAPARPARQHDAQNPVASHLPPPAPRPIAVRERLAAHSHQRRRQPNLPSLVSVAG